MAKRREPVVDVPGRPAREMPAGMFKCQLCGRTLDVVNRVPGLPPEWACCVRCDGDRCRLTPPRDVAGATAGPQRPPGEPA